MASLAPGLTARPDRRRPTAGGCPSPSRGVLRGAGLNVPIGSVLTFTDALAEVGVSDRDAVYWAGRATLVRRPEDHDLYDRAFAVFWEGRQPSGEPPEPAEPLRITLAVDAEDDAARRRRRRRARAERRPDDHAALQRPRGAPPQGLRGLLLERARRVPPPDGRPPPGRRPPAVAPAGQVQARPRPPRPPPDGPSRPAGRRRADAAPSPASRATGPGGWSSCSTSRARWSPTPGRCSASSTPPWPAGSGSRPSRSAPA